MQKHDAEKFVQITVGRDSLLPLKPAPDMILEARRAGVAAARETIYVGDTPADHAAARAADVTFYGIADTPAAREGLLGVGATEIYTSPAALAARRNPGSPG